MSNAVVHKKSEKEIANEKSKRILNGVAYWGTFYRENPQRFVKDYLNIQLKDFQKILLYEMMHENYTMFWASRGLGKTWLTALFCVVRCILYPKTKICVASTTRQQANEVLSKIEDDFMKNYGWGSAMLRSEIDNWAIGQNNAFIDFRNGSWIKVVTASDTGRSKRGNIIIIDEFVKVDNKIITTVLKRFLTTPRLPNYLNKPKYKHMTERNKEIYMSSCWLKSHWSYDKFKSYYVNMLDPTKKYFTCGLPYQIAIKEGLLQREQIEDEMSELDFDEITFSMEMGCIPFGDTNGTFFKFEDISARRKLKMPFYAPSHYIDKQFAKVPDLVPDERRILSIDVALMASKNNENDASSMIINSSIPNNNKFIGNMVFLENHEGMTTDALALLARKYFNYFKCTDIVVDTNGNGLGVFDELIKDIVDPETGEVYQALTCCNDERMAMRCKVANALPVIWSIKATPQFNDINSKLLRQGLKQGKINLLISEIEADIYFRNRIKKFNSLPAEQQFAYKLPYIQTSHLAYELVNLQMDSNIKKGGNNRIKLVEKSSYRKDRFSSLMYNYYVQCELEREVLSTNKTSINADSFANCIKRLNKRPTMY